MSSPALQARLRKIVDEKQHARARGTWSASLPSQRLCSTYADPLLVAGTHVLDEAERSLHDALCVLSQTVVDRRVLLGGGWPEMAMAHAVHTQARPYICMCALTQTASHTVSTLGPGQQCSCTCLLDALCLARTETKQAHVHDESATYRPCKQASASEVHAAAALGMPVSCKPGI